MLGLQARYLPTRGDAGLPIPAAAYPELEDAPVSSGPLQLPVAASALSDPMFIRVWYHFPPASSSILFPAVILHKHSEPRSAAALNVSGVVDIAYRALDVAQCPGYLRYRP